ncbi:MAG: YjdF family protein [Clostridia bacterium]|nr:YjdF family protein [Clostridia bacterium]
MQVVYCQLTVLFEDPFWVAFYELEYQGEYQVCKILFGAEPRDYEIYEYFLHHRLNLSSPVQMEKRPGKSTNPKRRQREIQQQVKEKGIGTKAQQALKLQQEQGKLAQKVYNRQKKLEEQQRQFELKQQKRKEKHRGH